MQKLKLTNVNPTQSAKVLGVLYIPFGLLYVVFGTLMILFSSNVEDTIGGYVMVATGVLLPLMGFVMVWLMMLWLNWVMKKCGGITFTFEAEGKKK